MTIPDLLDSSNSNVNNGYANQGTNNETRNGQRADGRTANAQGNNNGAIVPFGEILIDDGDRPEPTSYVPPAATPIIDDGDDARIPQAKYETHNAHHSRPPYSGPSHYEQYQQQQYQQHGQSHQYSPYVYATSYAGQPVLVSISPVVDANSGGNSNQRDGLPAAHHENPVTKGIRRERRRRRRAFVGGLSGMVAGGVVLGPFGLIIGYFTGSAVGLSSAIAGENRKDRRLRREREAYARAAQYSQ